MSDSTARKAGTAADSAAAATTGHTPGPWHYVGHLIVGGKYGMTVCQLSSASMMPGSITEQDANARLIAAAPCLLEQLENAMSWLDQYTPHERITAMRAAIKKARGET